MEAVNERVGESSRNRQTRPRDPRKSFAESPPSQSLTASRKKQKRDRAISSEATSEIYYEVKDILDEKTEDGQKRYLIDWKDNTETGERYTPTWEPHHFVTRKAIRAWNRKKERGRTEQQVGGSEEPERPHEDLPQPSSSFDPDSQPIRTAKRKRANPSEILQTFTPSIAKKPRRAGTAETARFQSVLKETIHSGEKLKEIKDSYEDQSIGDTTGRFRVEIPVDEDFDRDAYSKVTVLSSQPSQITQVPQNSLSTESSLPSRVPLQSHLKSPGGPPFIWDEDDESLNNVPVIQESQFEPTSSTYTFSLTQASIPATSQLYTAEPDLASNSSLAQASAVAVHSTESSCPVPENLRPPSRTSEFEDSELSSSEADESGRTRSEDPGTLEDRSQVRHILQPFSDLSPSRNLECLGNQSSDPPTTHSSGAPRLFIPLVNHLPYPSRTTASQTSSHPLGRSRSHPPSHFVIDDSSLRFQTQIPFAAQDRASSQNSSCHVRARSLPGTQRSIHSTQSQTSAQEPPLGRPLSAIKSSFEVSRPGAQIQSASPSFRNQGDQLSVEAENSSTSYNNLDLSAELDFEQDLPTALTPTNADTSETWSESPNPKSASQSDNHLQSEVESDPLSEREQTPETLGSENVLPSVESYKAASSPSTRPPPPPSDLILQSSPGSSSYSSLSDCKMADHAMGEMSTAEKLRRARAAAAESKLAEQRAARNASSIPQLPPPPVNQMLPLREIAPEIPVIPTTESALLPQSLQNPEESSAVNNPAVPDTQPKASPTEEEEPVKGVTILPLGDNAFAIPLPMVSLARDIYDQEIINHQPQRRAFLNDDKIDRDLVTDILDMIDRLKMICDHQALINESASQTLEPDHRQAKWAENISTKCIFLAEFCNSLKPSQSHVVLLVRPGRMMDILETMFRTHNYTYSVPSRSFNHPGEGLMKISLLPTNVEPRDLNIGATTLILAFDSTFQKTPCMESLRAAPAGVNRVVPLAHLVITHSIEHLELCLTKNIDHLERMAVLVSWLSQTREEVGRLDVASCSPDITAKSLAEFVAGGGSGEWPLPQMPIIEEIELPVMVSGYFSEAQLSGSTTQSNEEGSLVLQSAFKRPLLDQENPWSFKRQRLTPNAGFPSSGANILEMDEAGLGITGKAFTETNGALGNISKENKFDADQEDQISALHQKLTKLELHLKDKELTEVELRETNQRLDARCQDYEKSIEKIVPKYQEALNDRGQAAHDIQESMARETTMRQKLDARIAELTKVKEQKALADTELAAARTSLLNSSIPQVVELQKLKDELTAARLDVEKAQKKIASSQNEIEFMRSNYQTASSAAADMRNELDELKAQNAVLARKASDNTVEIHRINVKSGAKQYLQLISNLEVEKAAIERELEKKSEELRSLQNGRRGTTRGTSVPRSPRMGTMSPGQTSRPMARVLGGNGGSRGNSPAPGGEMGFRGPGTFGDALFPASGAPNRWGNHLS